MLVNFFQEKKTISYEGCLSQIFFLVTCAGTEGVLLAAMAYDRYVAMKTSSQTPPETPTHQGHLESRRGSLGAP